MPCETIFEEKALACRGITGFPNLETVILTGKLADNYLTIEFFSNAPALKKAELFHSPAEKNAENIRCKTK